MAKATAICTCKTCGAKFEKTAIKRNRSECDSWEAWAVETFDECPACWGASGSARLSAAPRCMPR